MFDACWVFEPTAVPGRQHQVSTRHGPTENRASRRMNELPWRAHPNKGSWGAQLSFPRHTGTQPTDSAHRAGEDLEWKENEEGILLGVSASSQNQCRVLH